MAMVSTPGAVPRRSYLPVPGPVARWVAVGLLLPAAGCDFPTALPKWTTEWLVPVESTTLTATQLLPSSVSFTSDGSAFTASVTPVSLSGSLGELCGPCASANGLLVPKPAFTATLADTLRLPAEAPAATLASGTVAVVVTNGLGFDPLRPSAAARGTLTVTVRSGSTTLGRLVLAGDSVALPAGGSLSRSVPLSAGTVTNRLVVEMTLASPAGDPVRIDTSQRFSLTASAQALRLSDVSVTVNQKQATLSPFTLDLAGVDASLVDRVQSGSLVLDVVNPLGVTGNVVLRFMATGMTPIQKTVPLPAGPSHQVVDFTQQELRSMLGRQVTATASGVVSAPGPVKLTPAAAVQITTNLGLVVGPKES